MHRLALSLIVLATPALSAEVHDCRGFEAAAENIAEPWEENTRTFAQGAVRVAILDTAEPAAAAFHLLVLSPPYDELGLRQCRVVSFAAKEGAATGYGSLSLTGMTASYDPATGLTLELPAQVTNPETGLPDHGALLLTIDQATGRISAEDIGS